MKRKVFVVADNDPNSYAYNAPPRPKNSPPTFRDLHAYNLVPSTASRIGERTIRYMQLDAKRLAVEVWETYNPKDKGRLGRQRSVLRARYTMLKLKETSRDEEKFKPIGTCEQYHWTGGVSERVIFSDDGKQTRLKEVHLNSKGQLIRYDDMTRGEFNPRRVQYSYGGDGERELIRWRGRYRDFERGGWRHGGPSVIIRVTEDGTPLVTNGNYLETTYRKLEGDDKYKSCEVRFVAGRKHGVEKTYNKFGRVIDEDFFHHGVEVPRWMAVKPEDVTINEILDESNAEVRRAILEMQGFEVFLSRCEAAGQLKVIDQDPDEKVGTLIRINLPKLGFSNQRLDDMNTVLLLKVKDGTLPKHYVLRVPPTMKTARQANAWTWGLKENEYAPAQER